MIRYRYISRTLLFASLALLLVSSGPSVLVSWAQRSGEAEGARKGTDLERLIAIAEIHQLKARYFRCMDTKDAACVDGLFAKDAYSEFSPGRRTVGGANIAASLKAVFNRVTIHSGGMPEIEV